MSSRPRLVTKLFVLVWIAGFLQEFQWSLLIQFPGFLTDLGATESRIGVLYSASAVLALAVRPAVGKLMDEVGRRRILLVAGVINAAAILSFAIADDFGPFLFGVFVVQRVMQIVLFTAMLTFNADIVPVDRRTEGLALLGLAGLTPLATGGIAGDVIIDRLGFDALFVASALAGAVSWLVVLRLPKRVAVPVERERRSFFAAVKQRDLLPLWLASLLFAASLEILFTFLRTFVDERQVGSVGAFLGLYGLMAIVSRLSASSRLDSLPSRPVIAATMSGYVAMFALLATANTLPPFVLAALVAGIAHGISFPMLASQVVARSRNAERGSAMTFFTAIFDIALLTAAPVLGALIDWQNYTVAFHSAAVAIGVGVVLYVVWDRTLESEPSLVES